MISLIVAFVVSFVICCIDNDASFFQVFICTCVGGLVWTLSKVEDLIENIRSKMHEKD